MLLTQIVPEQEKPASLQLTWVEQDAFNIAISRAKIKLYVATSLPKIT